MVTSSFGLSRSLAIGEILRRSAYRSPKRRAFSDQNRSLVYRDLEERALQIAAWLQQNGIENDDNISFLFKNRVEFVECFFGICLSGATGVPINFRLSAEEIKYILSNSESKILFTEPEYIDAINSVIDEVPTLRKIVIVENKKSLQQEITSYQEIFSEELKYIPQEISNDDPCMIVYTSGTTGKPKGAILSHQNLYINAQTVILESKMDYYYNQLIVTPLFHVAGVSTIIISSLLEGSTHIKNFFDPVDFLKTVDKEKINATFLAPSMWNLILQVDQINQYDVKSMKWCMSGGAPCPLEVKKKIIERFENGMLFDAFGQTEMSPTTTALKSNDSLRKTDSVGKPIMGVEVRVVDENMNDVPIGEVGEIIYRGPTVFLGYYKNPEATSEAFYGGWFHSGDLVRMDEEGFIYIVDRKKDMIISGGENIYPVEVEEALYKHPAILEAAVIGVPDKEWGETVKAYVVLKECQIVSKDEIVEHCKKYLASYKKPKFVEFIDELPRNPSGKILKRILRENVKQN
ncbi:long-chain-fatty-acid--CoA ligase [Oceanobacillus piezotolerans]|uniref:Long-chain-fatty-acid--CoA ligase n=1 Tax=Oceanobacillus piezotolerans TaxID=2448030 RepID=A0A498DAY4_9BACI|nr:long-chain fatty acid--CoA ligase [Oceanobacillus piezotolerans]RLL46854.1 long-chain-fatty-acid--CoA ligase [Oceanobacillus piezotolerans]